MTTREPPHCSTCCCGTDEGEEIARLRAENEKLREIDSVAPLLAEVDRLRMAAKIQEEVWHQVRLRLTPASGDPYNGLIEAADDLIADRDRLRAEVERLKPGLAMEDICGCWRKDGEWAGMCDYHMAQETELEQARARIAELEARLLLAEKVCEAAEKVEDLFIDDDYPTGFHTGCDRTDSALLQQRVALAEWRLAAWREGK